MKNLKRLTCGLMIFCLSGLLVMPTSPAMGDTTPPEPSTNAASHYCRALLLLGTVPTESRQMLGKPIFEVFGDASKEEIHAKISPLIFEGRHAIRAALHGCEQDVCQFGIDYCDAGQGSAAYHAPLMLELNRLVTLAGIQQAIEGNQQKALTMFMAALNMGQHMADEPTLIEDLVGIEMMENAYYTLALWGTRCDDPKLIKAAFQKLQDSKWKLTPGDMMLAEASILNEQVDRLLQEYPDGRWAEMMLESWGELPVGNNKDELKAQLMQVAAARGTSPDIFKDRGSLEKAAERFRTLHVDYFKESATCLRKQGMERAKCAAAIFAKYRPEFDQVGDSHFIDVRDVARHVATSQAERVMARVALAVSAAKKDGSYPTSLDAVKGMFGGQLPTSPYDGSAVSYQTMNGGKDFLIQIGEAKLGDVIMPQIDFTSVRAVEGVEQAEAQHSS